MLPIIQQSCNIVETELSQVKSQTPCVESNNGSEFITSFLTGSTCESSFIVSKLLKEYIDITIPEDINDLLLAITTSMEINKIFIATIPYFQNLLILKEIFTQSSITETEVEKINEQLPFQIANCDYKTITEKAVQIFPTIDLTKNAKLNQFISILQKIKQHVTQIEFNLEENEEQTLHFTCKYKNCKLNFDFLNNIFDYKTENIISVLKYLISNGEVNPEDQIQIQHFIENNRAEDEIETDQTTKQTVRTFIQRTITRQGIKIVNDQNICIKALIKKAVGGDFSEDTCVVTPQQLVLCFIEQKGFQLPSTIQPFFINKKLYYQLIFDIGDFKVLSSFQGVYETFMVELTNAFSDLTSYYKSTAHRLLVFPNYSLDNIFIKETIENEVASYKFKFIGIQTSILPIQQERIFIHQNMKQEYVFQFMIADMISQLLILNDPLIKYQEHFTKLAITVGEDQVILRYYENVLTTYTYLKFMLQKVQQAPHFLYFCVTKHNVMTESILAVFTILKSGFLRLKHPSFQKFVQFQMNYYEFIHYDRQTIFQTLLQHVQTYFKKPENDSKVLITHRDVQARQYVIQQMPIISSFMEDQSLGLENTEEYKPVSSSSILQDVQEDTAKNCLIALVHELQHIPRHGYASEIDTLLPFLPQILADSTSISPLCSSIRFHYKDQQGIDAGGMWRQTLSMMFNDLLGETEITNDVLYKIKEAGKFGKRELKFEELNKGNPNPASLLKAINLDSHTVLVPHYNGYICRTSSSVYPRLTDKRSCLYYFGRIVAFCLIYSGKMPNFLHENFWKALVGGRLYFDEETQERYKDQLERDQMFKINGTKPLSQMYYEMSDQQIETYYKPWCIIWKQAQDTTTDLDFLGIHQETINEIQQSSIVLSNPQHLKKYAIKALNDMKSGAVFAKSYSEFRNGFRHPFATSMATPINQVELLEMAKLIDKCLEVISFSDLESILTFDPHYEEYLNRQTIIENLFRRNVARIQMEIDDTLNQVTILEVMVQLLMDKNKFSHKQILDLVYACTGARTLTGTEITVSFTKPQPTDIVNGKPIKRLMQFHTCFNQMDIPLLYVASLNSVQLQAYIQEGVDLALKNGFAMM